MHLRVIDFGVDKYGLNAWIYDRTNDGKANYDKVLFSRTKSAADAVGTLKKGEWADVKVKIAGGASAGKTAGMLVKVEELTRRPLTRPALPHVGQSRDRDVAELARRVGLQRRLRRVPRAEVPDLDRRRLRGPRGRRHVARRPTSEQGLYWKTGHQPMLEYVVKTYKPDLLLAGIPTTDEFQHQFLGLVSPKLPDGAANPAYDDVDLNGKPGRPGRGPRGLHPHGLQGGGRGPDPAPAS